MVNSGDRCLFPSIRGKEVFADFNGGHLSSAAGILLLKQLDGSLGLTTGFSDCIQDTRQQSKVRQSVLDMVGQRVFGIALGYEDCNDFDTLCSDPLFKVAAARPPISGEDLASQPTLSRLENSITLSDLMGMAEYLVRLFINRYRDTAPLQIIIDLDATDDPAHGQQELEFYHGYYGCHCFLPLLVYGTADGGEQSLLAAVLRPGNKHAGHGSVGILRRLLSKLREAFPTCRFIVRGDAGFALPALYAWCDRSSVEYAISLPKNSRLRELSSALEQEATSLFEQSGQKVRHFGQIFYAAQTWPEVRRVVVKAEMTDKGYNPRFVVSNLPADDPVLDSPELLYDFYTDRGDVENRIKELKIDLRSGRTSCHRFLANQFRLLLHAAAFVLLQALRSRLAGTEGAHWQVGTVRTKMLKVGALVTESVRRIAIKLPTSYPLQRLWKHLAVELT
jgi:hypothetical protein